MGTSSSQLETLVQRSHFIGTSGQDLEMNKITKKNFTTTSIKVVVTLLRESGNLSVLAPSPLISYCGRGVFGHVCWSKNMFSTFHTPRACSHPPSYPMPRLRTIDIKKEEQRAKGQPSIFKPEDKQPVKNSRKNGQRNRTGARQCSVLKIKDFKAELLKELGRGHFYLSTITGSF